MKLEILGAEEKDGKFVLKVNYDWEFCRAVAKKYGRSYASEEDVEDFILYVLDDVDIEKLDETRYEIDE
jgi:hypothetical protein